MWNSQLKCQLSCSLKRSIGVSNQLIYSSGLYPVKRKWIDLWWPTHFPKGDDPRKGHVLPSFQTRLIIGSDSNLVGPELKHQFKRVYSIYNVWTCMGVISWAIFPMELMDRAWRAHMRPHDTNANWLVQVKIGRCIFRSNKSIVIQIRAMCKINHQKPPWSQFHWWDGNCQLEA